MPRFRILAVLWLAATAPSLCATGPACAEAKSRTTSDVTSIKRFMEEGQAFFVIGQYERAAEVFDKGYAKHPYSAFLFNAGVALEKSNKLAEAVEHFKQYLKVDPTAPDAKEVAKRIDKVEQAIADQKSKATKPSSKPNADADSATKSLVIIDTEPPGANLHILRRMRGESNFLPGGENPEWQEVLMTHATANASLDVGQYHVQVEGLEGYRDGATSFEVLPGHVMQVKVSLSEKDFMGHLRVTSNVGTAAVYLDDPNKSKPAWGRTPHSELVSAGEHSVLVLATGYEPATKRFTLSKGEHQELQVDLQRLSFGTLRMTSNVSRAKVFLDGSEVSSYTKSTRSWELQNLKAGTHRLRVLAEGRKPLEAEVQIPRGQVLPAYAHLVVFPPRAAAYAQAIIGGVLLGGGIYFGLESNRLYGEMKEDRASGTLASNDPRELRGKLYSVGADLAFVGSAVLSGLSIYNFTRDPLPPSRLVARPPLEFDTPPSATTTAPTAPPKRANRSESRGTPRATATKEPKRSESEAPPRANTATKATNEAALDTPPKTDTALTAPAKKATGAAESQSTQGKP